MLTEWISQVEVITAATIRRWGKVGKTSAFVDRREMFRAQDCLGAMRVLGPGAGVVVRPSLQQARHRLPFRSLLTSVRSASTDADPRKAYSHTLLLPKTALPLKQRNPAEAEQAYRSRTTDELYKLQVRSINPLRPDLADPADQADR